MHLPRPMKADDESKSYFEYSRNSDDSVKPWNEVRGFDDGWAIEPKIDGIRAFLVVEDGNTSVWIGTSHALVRHELPQLTGLENKFDTLILDGELSIPGQPLGPLVGAINGTRKVPLLGKVVFFAFDVLSFNGQSYANMPLASRRVALETLAETFPAGIGLTPQFPVSLDVIDAVKETGFEGVMLKDLKSTYIESRSSQWRKIKWLSTIDCFVSGSDPGKGGFSGLVGALKMSVWDDNGNAVEIGKHGVFPMKLRRAMTADDGTLRPEWVGKVMEVTYQAVGTDMRLRHPRLYRLRDDKDHTECSLRQLHGVPAEQVA